MDDCDNWPGSIVEIVMIKESVGGFLRTHRNGSDILYNLLKSVPPDRTEEQYKIERAQARAEHERLIEQHLADYNARRQADGLLPIDRKGNVIGGH
jgi:hypothetical protein